jgi:hypothetical protein
MVDADRIQTCLRHVATLRHVLSHDGSTEPASVTPCTSGVVSEEVPLNAIGNGPESSYAPAASVVIAESDGEGSEESATREFSTFPCYTRIFTSSSTHAAKL